MSLGRRRGYGGLASLQNLVDAAQRLAGGMPPRRNQPKPGKVLGRPYGSLSGPSARVKVLLPRYAELFAQRDEFGQPLTLEAVASQMGVTRERVRQIRLKYFPELETKRVEQHTGVLKRRAAKRFRQRFRRMVRSWLHEAGYFQCCHCFVVKCSATDRTKNNRPYIGWGRCKKCTADKAWLWWQIKANKERAAEWQRTNKDKCKEYTKRYRKRKRLGLV